jgi:hypothetical protein
MEYLLFPKKFKGDIIQLDQEKMVWRSATDLQLLSFEKLGDRANMELPENQDKFFTPQPGSAARKEILDAIRIPSEKHFGQAVVFKVNTLRVTNSWAFFVGEVVQPNGDSVDYKKSKDFARDPHTTKLALEAGSLYGGVDALLKKEGRTWSVLAITFDAGDVHWLDYDKRYGVPTALIAEPIQ